MLLRYVCLVCLLLRVAYVNGSYRASVVLTMLCRDEAVNLKANLPLWIPFIERFVFVIDTRNTDNSIEVIHNVLSKARKDYKLVSNNFTGFGAARTLGLEAAWENYPSSTHVMISDPDWVPIDHTIVLNELDNSADVFRFTIFDAERGGHNNKRAMDWLLLNRAGNAMKYHLHEVISIGNYTVKLINWQVREVEKQGTWHTTVGHDTSTSASRYQFDLDLLNKDLDMYGHEAHVDYYLGITHQGFATKALPDLGPNHPQVLVSIDSAIHYLTLRATSVYSEEFLEQRWGSMIELGNIFTYLKRDDIKAIYWLSMCRDLDSTQPDCSMLLCQLYIRLGQLTPALLSMHDMLSTERGSDRLSQLLDVRDCDLPSLAVDIMRTKATAQGISTEEAMYFFLLLDMVKTPSCAKRHNIIFNRDVRAVINSAVGATAGQDYFETSNSAMCSNPVLQRYLAKNGYTVHPCEEYRASRIAGSQCDVLMYTSPPSYEEFQLGSFGRKFIGPAIIPDIVHHVYRGEKTSFLGKARPLRFLFAEHFSVDMVLNLFGQLEREPSVVAFEIVVVSPDQGVLDSVVTRLEFCQSAYVQDALRIKRVHQNLLSYASAGSSRLRGKFDYIEYNGGLSRAENPNEEIAALVSLLHNDGVIGFTYFARNFHTEQVNSLVSQRNLTNMVPFSMDASRLVKNYLSQYRLELFLRDTELVDHLSKGYASRVFSQHEVEELVASLGLHIAAWIPSAYARPFEEMRHHAVLKYQAMGVSQERFVEDLMANFRYSIYLVKQSNEKSGRLKLSKSLFRGNSSTPDIAAGLVIHDRLSNLKNSFAAMEQLALRQLSTAIEFAHYALPGDIHFSFVLSPLIAPSLPHLTSMPTLLSLHEINRDFAVQNRFSFDEEVAQDLLISTLQYLEKLNLIAFEYDNDIAFSSAKARRAKKIQTMAERSQAYRAEKKLSRESETTVSSTTDTPRTIGGLNVRSMPYTTPTAPSPSSSSEKPTSMKEKVGKSTSGVGILTKEEEIERMRKLGYSDDVIEQLLGVDMEEYNPSTVIEKENVHDDAIATSKISPSGETDSLVAGTESLSLEESAVKARGIIDLLQRFKQQRVSDSNTNAVHAEASIRSKDVISEQLTANSDRQERRSDTVAKLDLAPKFHPKEQELPSNKASGGLSGILTGILGGGLKLPAQEQRNSADGIIKQDSKSFTQRNGQHQSDGIYPAVGKKVDKAVRNAYHIKMPPIQPQSALEQSHRGIVCIDRSEKNVQSIPAFCTEDRAPKRKTALRTATSIRKVEFDLTQINFILSHYTSKLSTATVANLENARDNLIAVMKFLREVKLDGPYRVARLLPNMPINNQVHYMNRALNIAEDLHVSADELVHQGAMNYLHSIRREVDKHDYLVVDVILQDAAMKQLSQLMLSSTVWFDASNGAAFVSHHDDGLVFPTVHTLVKEIALALSEKNSPLAVKRFFTVAMDLQYTAYSPVFMASKDDFVVILWLNPQTASSDANGVEIDHENGSDGLRIYSEASASKLFSQGVSVYPSAHSDFLSRSSNLAIDLSTRCTNSTSEFVPRSPNRLVVVRSNKLCTLLAPGIPASSPSQRFTFEESTMIALVIVLSPA